MLTIGVLISGSGSNLQAIIDQKEKGSLPVEISCVISNKETAYGLERAKKHGIPSYFVNPKEYSTREDHEKVIVSILKEHHVDIIVMAGYMRILTPWIIHEYQNRIINIHPALLPSFPGAHGIQDAFNYGVKYTGVTVHIVNEGVDSGPIIAQSVVSIDQNDTLDTLESKIHQEEHQLYPYVIGLFANDRITLDGRKVIIK